MLVQSEVVLTRSTQFLLNLPGAVGALDGLIMDRGLHPEPGGYWLTEVRGDDGARTDLEYRWGGSQKPQVLVEAKIGHSLPPEQLEDYRARLVDDGLLVALVPVTRRHEADGIVEELRTRYADMGDPVRVAVWTWDEVVDCLERALPNQPDVEQVRGLVSAAGALDLVPFEEPELLTSNDTRFEDLWAVLRRASASTADYPAQSRSGQYFQRYRFCPVGAFDAWFSVGMGRTNRAYPEPWIWARIGKGDHHGHLMQLIVREHRRDVVEELDGSVVFPLHLTPNLSGFELSNDLRRQLDVLAGHLAAGLREKVVPVHAFGRDVDPAVLDPLHQIGAFTAGELLESQDSRRTDVELVVHQVCRHLFGRGPVKWLQPDSAFLKSNWMLITPHRSALSIGLGRVDGTPGARPWAWLAVPRKGNPNADLLFATFKDMFPDRVEETPNGLAVPLNINAEENGIEAFTSVVSQVEAVNAACLHALNRVAGL